jgi:hypothetical protein
MLHELKKAKLASSVPVLSIVKNEIFFLPAFLDHYRGLGAKQFIFLDDRSDDGTSEYLLAQDDCTVVASDLTYGQYIDGKKANVLWRTALPQKYCQDGWGLLVDADEFLELPPGFEDIEAFTRFLDHRGATAIGAVMVDFYPDRTLDLQQHDAPQNKADLLARYPYFDDCHHGSWIDGCNEFRRAYGGVRHRLMLEHRIASYAENRTSASHRVKSGIRRLLGIDKEKFFCALHKVPLIRWDEGCCHTSSHTANRAPNGGIQLPLMHFKFTGSLLRKIDFAIASEGYHNQSSDYRAYRDLLGVMMQRNASFLGSNSRKYSSKQDFIPNRILSIDLGRGETLDDHTAMPARQQEAHGDPVA